MGKYISPDFDCPCCGSKDGGHIIQDYSERHNKEVMLECFKCDSVYIYHYGYIRTEILSDRCIKRCGSCINLTVDKHKGYFCCRVGLKDNEGFNDTSKPEGERVCKFWKREVD